MSVSRGRGRVVVAAGALLLSTVVGCTGAGHRALRPAGRQRSSAAPVITTMASRPAPAPRMVRWHGPVEGIFVHPLVINPRLAFTRDQLGVGFQHFFVTAYEFRRILVGLWRHGWTLVDAHRAATGTVRVPAGRKPLVLSEDDVNYYAYFRGRGLASRLVLDRRGDVRAEYHGRLTTNDVVPIVDEFVAHHPAFSADGAKGVLAVTGYEGLLGEHHLAHRAARARVRALAARLEATGWLFASHSYGHIDTSADPLSVIDRDTRRWRRLATPLIGPTDLYIYPFGAVPTDAGVTLLRRAGFRIQFDIDVVARRVIRDGAIVMSRLHVDGYAFDAPARMAPLFSVRRVRDPRRP